jgi:hypothetical protein
MWPLLSGQSQDRYRSTPQTCEQCWASEHSAVNEPITIDQSQNRGVRKVHESSGRSAKTLPSFALLLAASRPVAHRCPTSFVFRLKRFKSGNMAETLNFRGSLKGHQGWVTAIATPLDPASDIVLSASR